MEAILENSGKVKNFDFFLRFSLQYWAVSQRTVFFKESLLHVKVERVVYMLYRNVHTRFNKCLLWRHFQKISNLRTLILKTS